MKFLRQFMSNRKVEKKYVSAGAKFGNAVSYLYMGECIGFESMLDRWADWEQEYADRGYRTIPLDNFIELGGYGKNISPLFRQKLEENEEPIFHAKIYRDNYSGGVKPIIDLNEILSGNGVPQFRTYTLPSTKPSS